MSIEDILTVETIININNFTTMEAIMMRDQRTTSHRVFHNNNTNCFQYFDGVNRTLSKKKSRVCVNNSHHFVKNNNRFSKCENSDSKINKISRTDLNNNNNRRNDRDVESGVNSENFSNDWSSGKTNCSTWLRLASLLIVLLFVTANGKPAAPMAVHKQQFTSTPKWINPCGEAAENSDGSIYIEQMKDEQLLGTIILRAKNALDHAKRFCDHFSQESLGLNFESMQASWNNRQYYWLPGPLEIPKQLGTTLSEDYLSKLEVRMIDSALLNAYEYMQKYAVGLEQITYDQKEEQLNFQKEFVETEHNLRSVLCELQVAMMERGVPQRIDVSRDIMPDMFRQVESITSRNTRDWIIFRDYMNGLEYVVQVFEHLKNNLESS
ncbi:uncharacterized protein LOC123270752 isoform X3 [Cotesia glomerata]|uniref:uncharacterized protein LOC123270752 isoform X3 n=1 Tax=Cotesia glomerata TaxID=32391 RepID=UPI001D023ED5|nr:uncharacterized protein LOC123270752 isoform X3 [Cotesia glomerata]